MRVCSRAQSRTTTFAHLAQSDGLIEVSHAQLFEARVQEDLRGDSQAVAIAVALDHGQRDHALTHVLQHRLRVCPQYSVLEPESNVPA